MTNLLVIFYSDCKPHTNSEMYCFFELMYGYCDESLKHSLRGLQQNLKRQGYIRNVAYSLWVS